MGFEELKKRLSELSLVINRVPKNTKEKFIAVANLEFVGDYGMLLKTLVDDYFEYNAMKKTFFENINFKLDNILENISNEQKEAPDEVEVVETVGGKRIEFKKEVKKK